MPAKINFLHRPLARYLSSVLVVGVAFALRLAFTRHFGSGLTYITFSPAVMLAAMIGGLGPGLLATVLSALLADYYIIPPLGEFGMASLGDAIGLSLFCVMGLFMSSVAELYHRARRKALAYARELAVREEQVRAAVETERQRQLLEVTLTSIGDAVIAGDGEGRITFLNPVAAGLTGWTAEEVLGRPFHLVFRIINEKTHEPAEDIVARVLREGQVIALANHTALVTKDGREVPIEDSAAPIKDAAGAVSGVVLVFHDVTQKRRAQEALRESERRVRQKLDSILLPEGDIGSLELADIIDVPAVQSLMDSFHEIAGLPMAIVDLKGQVLIGAGWQDICTKFHRVHPEACQHCLESDLQLSAGIPEGECRLYKCKSNMWDMATPIMVGGQHVGNLFTGQFFFAGEPPDRELFRAQAKHYGFDEEKYLAALDAVPRLTSQSVDSGMAFFMKLARMLSQLSYSGIKLARSLAERDALTDSLRRLNRTLRAISNSSQSLMHAMDEAALLREVCNIMIEDCGHAMVWIGYAEQDEGQSIRPVASAGFDEGYLESLNLTWADRERGRGPTGTAIRTGLPDICRNMLTDPRSAPWREQALQRGYASSIALPLLDGGKAFGAVTIYSQLPDPFSEDEVNLLKELSADLAYGIGACRMRVANARAEESVRQNREWLRVTLNSIGDAVLTTDTEGRVTFLNPVAEALIGWTTAEAQGQPIADVFKIINEQTGKPAADIVECVLRERCIVALSNHTALAARDGQTVPIEDSAAPILDDAGNVAGVVLVFHDVTQKRRAQQEREITIEFLHLVNQSAEVGDLVRAVAGFFQRQSGCEAVGIRLKEVDDFPYFEARGFPEEFVRLENSLCARDAEGRTIRDCQGNPVTECMCGNVVCGRFDPSKPFFTAHGSFWTNCTTQLLAGTSEADRQSRTRNRCNGEGYESVALIPLRLGDQRLGLLQLNDRRPGVFTPEIISLWERLGDHLAVALAKLQAEELVRLHVEQLAEADRRKDEFLAMLAHELRNPLAPIHNAVQLLKMRRGELDAKMQWGLDLIARQSDHMAHLVDDLLDVARITRGKIELHKQAVPLIDALSRAVEMVSPLIDARRHNLTLQIPSEPLRVEADLVRLAQIVGNLLNNAAKYMDEEGQIWLTARRDGEEAVISVRDAGAGIAPDLLPRVFDLFTQGDRSLDRAQGGLGLGLTLVRRLVDLHGGRVEAHSAGPGCGSEFVVRLPALPDGSQATEHVTEAAAGHQGARSRRILVVDDIEDSAASLAELLSLMGHETRAAHDGPAALEAVREFQPDVVLLDIGLPRMDGYEVARRLRQDCPGRTLLLVALTGYGQEEDRQRAREAGFDHHLLKPVDLDALKELLPFTLA